MDLQIFRAIADRLRPLAADIRTVTVSVRTRTWSGGRVGNGTASNVDVALPTYLKVEQLSSKEVASSGGRYRDGAVRIGPITPRYTALGTTGGFTVAQLRPTVTSAQEVVYLLAGDIAGEFALAELDTSKPLSWFVIANRQRSTP